MAFTLRAKVLRPTCSCAGLKQSGPSSKSPSRPRTSGFNPISQGIESALPCPFGRVLLGSEEVTATYVTVHPPRPSSADTGGTLNDRCVKSCPTIIERQCRTRQDENNLSFFLPDMFNGDNASRPILGRRARSFPSWLIRRTDNCDSAEMDPLEFPFCITRTSSERRTIQNDR